MKRAFVILTVVLGVVGSDVMPSRPGLADSTTPTPAAGVPATASVLVDSLFEQLASADLTVLWALSRFQEADLSLPHATIVSHESRDGCMGHVAIFVGVEPVPEIHLCFDSDAPTMVRKRVLLHELSHVWTHQNMTDPERDAFLAMRDLEHWGRPARWYRQGAEHAAEIMAWGLLDVDVGVLTVAPSDPESLDAGFRYLTGVDPICEPRPEVN